MLLAAVLTASISYTESPTIRATSPTESPGEMRQTICKWVHNTDQPPYDSDPPTARTPVPPNYVSHSCREVYSRIRYDSPGPLGIGAAL
jgi:hypothetical protein